MSVQQELDASLNLPSEEYLLEIATQKAEEYKQALPFSHIVLDNLFPSDLLETVLKYFPTPDYSEWAHNTAIPFQPKKLGRLNVDILPNPLRYILYQFNSKPVLQFLEKLTGIGGLIPDMHYRGGALHQILPGGFLEVHVDYNKHGVMQNYRRINMLVYLNQDWKAEYNGDLELWDAEMQHCVKKVAPVFNRTVIFSTTESSFHGHPVPLSCPPGMTRKSLAFYYYTNDPAAQSVPGHGTIWQARPGVSSVGSELDRLYSQNYAYQQEIDRLQKHAAEQAALIEKLRDNR